MLEAALDNHWQKITDSGISDTAFIHSMPLILGAGCPGPGNLIQQEGSEAPLRGSVSREVNSDTKTFFDGIYYVI